MKAITVLAVATVTALFAQPVTLSPRELLTQERPLTAVEVAAVLNASRAEVAGRTFRLSAGTDGRGLEILTGANGQPKMARVVYTVEGGVVGGTAGGSPSEPRRWREGRVDIIEYSGRPARRCDGTAEDGEMVIRYTFHSSTDGWTAEAYRREPHEFGPPGVSRAFEMLAGVLPATSGERRQIRGRWARAVVSPLGGADAQGRSEPAVITGDPLPNVVVDPVPNEASQSLWIDVASLLPLRWELSQRHMPTYALDFRYESIDLRPPANVDAPLCVR